MGFLKRNKFSNAWDMVILSIPSLVGLQHSSFEAMQVMRGPYVTASTGIAQQAFENGLDPDDAVLFGKAYLVAMISAQFPDQIWPEAKNPTLDEMSSVLSAKYGQQKIQQIRHFAEAFSAHVGVILSPEARRAKLCIVIATQNGRPLATVDDPPVDEALDNFFFWGFLHARVKGLSEGILKNHEGPLALLLTTREGQVLGAFDGDINEGYASSLSTWQEFADEVKTAIASEQVIRQISVPEPIPPSPIPPV